MRKIQKIDLSSERLIAITNEMVEDHNYIGALRMLNKNAERNGNDMETHMLYAEIYDDLGLYEKCVNCWFEFLDTCEFYDVSEAYEGLAVSFMNLGNERYSAFYYEKLLKDSEELDAEMRREIMNEFLRRDKNPLKFVYPPELADCSDIISDGVDKMRRGEFDSAVQEFEKVEEGNDAYLSARNYIAMCNIIADKCEEAEAECLALLEKYPDNIQALTTLAAVKTEQKKSEESAALARKLLTLKVTSSDDIYKIATVCCENSLHREAYGLFVKLGEELAYDLTVMYFKAVSAFNCGEYEESFKTFEKLLIINPTAVTAKYFYKLARSAVEKGEELTLGYFYRLPKELKEINIKFLSAFEFLTKSEAKKLYENLDITECINWCFDEYEGGGNDELQFLAVSCAVKAGLDRIVRKILLNAFLPDILKLRTLALLGGRNRFASYGVVVCNIYKRVEFRELLIGKLKRKNFVNAYARLCANFAVINPPYGERFALAAEDIYAQLSEKDALSEASDTDVLSAAIYHVSGVKEPNLKRDDLASFFETEEEKIKNLLKLIKVKK